MNFHGIMRLPSIQLPSKSRGSLMRQQTPWQTGSSFLLCTHMDHVGERPGAPQGWLWLDQDTAVTGEPFTWVLRGCRRERRCS